MPNMNYAVAILASVFIAGPTVELSSPGPGLTVIGVEVAQDADRQSVILSIAGDHPFRGTTQIAGRSGEVITMTGYASALNDGVTILYQPEPPSGTRRWICRIVIDQQPKAADYNQAVNWCVGLVSNPGRIRAPAPPPLR